MFQVEEKTVAHTTTTSGTRQEQRTVTQEVISTSTILAPETKKEVNNRNQLNCMSVFFSDNLHFESFFLFSKYVAIKSTQFYFYSIIRNEEIVKNEIFNNLSYIFILFFNKNSV